MAGRKPPVPRTTPALAALVAAGLPFTPRPYQHIDGVTAYGLEAAAALGVDPDRVFKTLMTSADGDLVTAVVPVSGSLDLKALARALRARKVTLADPVLAQRRTGYILGGISPLGQRHPSPVVVDESALSHSSILVSAGRRGLDVELAPEDLISATRASTALIAAPKPR
jgi:Cys-tRNA(Pro)/Cys-tRNA(Cys) deacylase